MSVRRPVRVLGLTGPVASGKSAFARLLESRGARVLSLDAVGHELLAEPPVRKEINAAFPEAVGIMDRAGLRRRLAEVAFADPERLVRLERILHPRMCDAVRRQAEAHRTAAGTGTLVVEGALLYEMGLDALCDAVVVVDAPLELRLARARAARGWSQDEVNRRQARQMPAEGKRLRADLVVENSGEERELEARAVWVWEELGCQ